MNNSRVLFIIFVMIVSFILLGVRLFTIQISKNEFYSEIAERQQNKSVTIRAERGAIQDRNGEVLAYTKNDVSIYVDKRMLNAREIDSVASFLAASFGKPKSKYVKLIENGKNNICLEKKVSKENLKKIEDFYVDGFFIEEDFSRVYPYGSLCSHLLGYVDNNFNGVYGIAKQYDKYLKGSDGIKFIENDVLGRVVSVDDNNSRKAKSGNTVVLTINKIYQTILEQELHKGIQEFKGDSASGIIMNPKTGEILALTSLPDFDPSNPGKFELNLRRNRAITDPFEPGSIIKPLVMSMLIEEKLVDDKEIINTENGVYKIRSTKIYDTHPHAFLTVKQVLEESSNIGMAKLSERLEADTFYRYLRDFGFGNATSIDLPGESNGYLKKPKDYSALSKPFMSFGYELSVTPIQMASAFCSLINGGELMQPYLVKEIKDDRGNIIEKFEQKKIRRILDKTTSEKIIDYMIGVVEEGTATNAKLNNVLVGGKTGTAQMLIEGSYSKKEYNSSFIGFFPAEDPNIVCFITVSSPSVGRYGGQVSAPIFRKIAERIIDADLVVVPEDQKIKRRKEYLEEILKGNKNSNATDGIKFSNVEEVKSPEPVQTKKINKDYMPNLVGMSVRDAIAILNDLGVSYKVIGSGKVLSQSIPVNQSIGSGSICLIKCETKKIADVRLN